MNTNCARMTRAMDRPDVFAAIHDPDCHLAIWRRAPFANLAPLVEGTPQDLRFDTTPTALPARLAAQLAQKGFGGPAALHAALTRDVADLAARFCAVMGLARLELRLEVVRSDSCRRFHADYVTARLITTYLGEGTQWLDAADAARVQAGMEPQRIHQLAPFDVGLFKGRLAGERPAIHRSPPIAGSPGGVRLLLVLNPVSADMEAALQSPLSRGAALA